MLRVRVKESILKYDLIYYLPGKGILEERKWFIVTLTEKQKKFCDEYLKDCNITKAYKIAYPNVKNDNVAGASGKRLLRNAKIKAYLDAQLEQLHCERIAEVKEIMEYLTSVMRGETRSSVLCMNGKGTQIVIQKPPSEVERLKACELLGKRYGIFTENIQLDADTYITFVDNVPLEDE